MDVPCETEATRLFRGLLLPVVARAFDAIPWRQRRGMVLDARLRLLDAQRTVQLYLAQLKFIHVGPTRYPAGLLNHDGRCLVVVHLLACAVCVSAACAFVCVCVRRAVLRLCPMCVTGRWARAKSTKWPWILLFGRGF